MTEMDQLTQWLSFSDQWTALQLHLMTYNPSTHRLVIWAGFHRVVPHCYGKVISRSQQGQIRSKSVKIRYVCVVLLHFYVNLWWLYDGWNLSRPQQATELLQNTPICYMDNMRFRGVIPIKSSWCHSCLTMQELTKFHNDSRSYIGDLLNGEMLYVGLYSRS